MVRPRSTTANATSADPKLAHLVAPEHLVARQNVANDVGLVTADQLSRVPAASSNSPGPTG